YGEFLVIDGFYWNGGVGTNNHIEFRRGGSSTDFANNSIISNCAFNDLVTAGDNKSRWIVLYGVNNTVENCSFMNKNSTGACVLVELGFQGTGTVGHILRNNYFYNFSDKDGRTNAGDSEAIRIGESAFQTINAGVLVEKNYFKETDGENEIITNKSRGNIYRNNTFRKSRGSLVLRHGAQALVEGNYFMGENKAKSGGIRVSDQDHVIINNYMQDLSNNGDTFNNGITLMGGSTASGGTSNGYQNVNNVLIAFNTIYNSDDPIFYNNQNGSSTPEVTVANNLIYSTNGTIVSGSISSIG
ncbi:MAG: polysaccharide lyase 6 family protein, partial [Nonlabens sp.]|nr:polysaccharide lyase 6 family protein [Nonlabens sp.]